MPPTGVKIHILPYNCSVRYKLKFRTKCKGTITSVKNNCTQKCSKSLTWKQNKTNNQKGHFTFWTLDSLKSILQGVCITAVVVPVPHWPDLLSPQANTLPRSVRRSVWLRPTAADTTVNSDIVSIATTPDLFSVSPTPSWPFSLRPARKIGR